MGAAPCLDPSSAGGFMIDEAEGHLLGPLSGASIQPPPRLTNRFASQGA